jgi:methylthioribose-1-phosphate isomerase
MTVRGAPAIGAAGAFGLALAAAASSAATPAQLLAELREAKFTCESLDGMSRGLDDAETLSELAEEAKVAIRNVRRDANKAADTEKGDGGLTEDDCDRCKEDVQELTKKYEGGVGDLAKTKEAEVMEQ